MGSNKAAFFVILGACPLFVAYACLDPPNFIANSSCCQLPGFAEYPLASGPALGYPASAKVYPTQTRFIMQLSASGSIEAFSGSQVGEYSPGPGDDTCHDDDPSSGILPWTEVTTPYQTFQWQVADIGPNANMTMFYDRDNWGYDFVGWTQYAATTYRQLIPSKLPCGTTIYQDMYFRCETNGVWGVWTMYTENYLTATINSASTYNCHDDSEGDYPACQTESY